MFKKALLSGKLQRRGDLHTFETLLFCWCTLWVNNYTPNPFVSPILFYTLYGEWACQPSASSSFLRFSYAMWNPYATLKIVSLCNWTPCLLVWKNQIDFDFKELNMKRTIIFVLVITTRKCNHKFKYLEM